MPITTARAGAAGSRSRLPVTAGICAAGGPPAYRPAGVSPRRRAGYPGRCR
ncbi:hypothetical protein GA0070216_11752 [Micromonospora matsumotoense]|uniref:Uncharacterized protein n=1 Tax=Micromonospora matsumotoense TaxID=121616 RepID=A0A1C5AH84_9ACTN|nr:hypothetical protein GA0070216_11752 [Micromonospora matsumotoense]